MELIHATHFTADQINIDHVKEKKEKQVGFRVAQTRSLPRPPRKVRRREDPEGNPASAGQASPSHGGRHVAQQVERVGW